MNDEEMLEQAIRMSRALTRRRFLRGSGVALGAMAVGPGVLAACGDETKSGGSGATSTTAAPTATEVALRGDPKLVISTWDAYIDTTEDGDPEGEGLTIDRFQKKTGIEVTYNVDYNDNEEYFNRVFAPNLGTGTPIGADIVVPTYWMAARLVGLGWLEGLPVSSIPNHANLRDEFLDLAWDPGAKWQMPWQAGIAGIAYNPDLTGKDILTFDDMLDPSLEGKVGMLTEMRDTVGIAMMSLGKDPSVVDMAGANAALDKIEQAKADGKVRAFTGNEYITSLETGDFVACLAWSGDVVGTLAKSKPNVKFVIPEEGGTLWFDSMVIPKGAPNTRSAAAWMDFVYDVDNAAAITEAVQFISPVKGVQEALAAKGGEAAALADNQILFPDEATMARLKVFANLSQDEEKEIQERFNDIIAG